MPHNMLDCVQRRQQHLLDLQQRQHQHHRQHLLIDRTCVDSSCSRAVRDRMRHRHSPTILSSASRTLERASFVISLLVFFFFSRSVSVSLCVYVNTFVCVIHSFIKSSNHSSFSLSFSLIDLNQFLSAIIVSLIVIVISTSVILACIIIVIITIIIIIPYCLHYSCRRRRRRRRCRCRRHHSVRCRSLHKQRLQQHVFISRCSSQGSDRLMYFSMSAATTRACLLQQRLRRVRHHDRDDASALRLSPIRHEVHRLE